MVDGLATPSYAGLPAWAQILTAILFLAGSGIVLVKGWFKAPGEGGKLDSEDIADALRHLKWIAFHAERIADAAEKANKLEANRQAEEATPQRARSPPRRRKSPTQ